jgi:hypothetical protein
VTSSSNLTLKKGVDVLLKFPFGEAIQLANEARPLLPRGRSLLYHGSRSPVEILSENVLRFSKIGIPAVSFTRLLVPAHSLPIARTTGPLVPWRSPAR